MPSYLRFSLPLVLGCLLTFAPTTWAQDDDDEEGPKYLPGLVASYSANGASHARIDDDLLFDWADKSPDSRIPVGPFQARWSGHLFVNKGGAYTFRAHLAGKAIVRLKDEVILEVDQRDADWVASKPVDLTFGYYPLSIEYTRTGKSGRFGLYWESDQFELETIPYASLVHAPTTDDPGIAQRGESLARAYRCVACHAIPLAGETATAPSLTKLNGAVEQEWLLDYLREPSKSKAHVRMPDFGLTKDEATAVASYLWTKGKTVQLKGKPKGDVAEGKKLAERLGCIACHTIGNVGYDALFGGGDLARIAEKRPAGFFLKWLQKPEELNAKHRMPVFELDNKEAANLAAYLATLKTSGAASTSSKGTLDSKLAETGRKILTAKRCASCHEIPGIKSTEPLPWKAATLAEGGGCLTEPDAKSNQPGYRFSDADRQAIAAFLTALPAEKTVLSPLAAGGATLEKNNCLNCHARANGSGLREEVAKLGVTDPKAQASLVPPSLNTVGDKMHDKWLADAVAGKATKLRPWLGPRMPKFTHSDADIESIKAYFIGHDRIPDIEQSQPELPKPESMLLGAHRLVGGAGFGCMSCHAIGSYDPVGVEPGARGSDLRFLDKRMRQPWFRRWTRNPARMVPGSEMPAITVASPGVLDGKIRTQLEALWFGLNAPRLDLPSANAIQVLAAKSGEPALILRDCFEHGKDDYTTRPLAIGLPNGHNLLIDLDRFSIRRWWLGDFAREKTRGKTWYWETAGVTLLDFPDAPSMIALRDKEKRIIEPLPQGQAVAKLESIENADRGVEFVVSLQFPKDVTVKVRVFVSVYSEDKTSDAFYSILSASSAPREYEVVYRQWAPHDVQVITTAAEKAVREKTGRSGFASVGFKTPLGTATVRSMDREQTFEEISMDRAVKVADPASFVVPLNAGIGNNGSLIFSTTTTPPGSSAPPQFPPLPKQVRTLPAVPGYETLRLALEDGPMPTGMSWRKDGSMVVSSLKGGVYLLRDSNKDGLLDECKLFSDHLAAPYGVLVEGDDVLVAHKPELLRLKDEDKDGRAERTEVLATGWGVTFDYHDWTVGPIRDSKGNLYIVNQVQQDDRSEPAAKWRGKVLEVTPKGEISEFAAGIRFGMGIAMNDRGDIFTSDNQGVTNPFNELNHIRKDHHYGFWNKLEPRPEGQVTTLPAIQLPHPWSRSVNGVEFIPDRVDFGPFKGQLIGADYTTRLLIRMSLQKIGDTYQGCAYPFSKADLKMIENDETFLGPVALSFGPDGCLYVGSMIDSGWGGGNNRGAMERVRFTGPVPFGIREVRAHAGGFDVDFTAPVDSKIAADPSKYTLSCYRRVPKGGYETPDQDRTNVSIDKIDVAADRMSVRLFVKPLRPTFVYDIAIGSLDGGTQAPYPDVAFYTLNQIPKE